MAVGMIETVPPSVEAVRLGKAYGRTWALRGVDLRIERGERVALLGPNGSGKTTLMRLIATLTRPTFGTLHVLGQDPARRAREVRRSLGVVAHRPYLYEDFTGRENLEFYARLYGVRSPADRYRPLVEEAGLAAALDRPVRGYSRGMQQRLALVRALLHDPALLLLDEPDAGLDQAALRFLESTIRDAAAGRTVVFSTHNLELGLRLSDRVVVLAGGSTTYDGPAGATTLDRLRDSYPAPLGANS